MTTPAELPPTTTPLAEAIRELQRTAREAADVKVVPVDFAVGDVLKGTTQVAFVPAGNGKLEVQSLGPAIEAAITAAESRRLKYAEGPDRRVGTAIHQSIASFIHHALRFKAPNSVIWADPAKRVLVAVLDYHLEGATAAARWGKHRGVYACPLSDAWLAWGGERGLELSQDDFAKHLDARDREVRSGELPNGGKAPDPSTLVTLASRLETFSEQKAKRERDQNGRVKVTFSEEKGISGDVAVPSSFLIEVPVFQDSPPQRLEVRLGVEVKEGHARFLVRIHAAGDILRDAFEELSEEAGNGTEMPVFVGTPEA